MPPPPRAIEAMDAMKILGFSKKVSGTVLKKLLKVYDENWEYIEENGYQVLIYSILEEQELKAMSGKTQDAADGDEPEHCRKRLRKVGETDPCAPMITYDSPVEALFKKPKLEPDIAPEASIVVRGAEPVSTHVDNIRKTTDTISSQPSPRCERAEHDSPLNRRETSSSARARKILPGDESGSEVQKNTMTGEADDNLPEFMVPIAMILPPNSPSPSRNEVHHINSAKSLATENGAHAVGNGKGMRVPPNIDTSREASSTTIDVASSDMGKVKLLFRFSSDGPEARIPSLDAVFQMVQERCLKSNNILPPDFSFPNVLKEMCQCALELSNEPNNDIQAKQCDVPSTLDECPQSLVVAQQPQIAYDALRPPHDPNDITKGQERVRIPLVNEVSNEKYPSPFHYISRSHIYQKAHVNISLARIGDEDCCSDCFGDCLAATVPCGCARVTGGEFAYTLDGLVKETFLDECVNISREPGKHNLVYCQDCPLERCKDGGMLVNCKGHIARKLIKECWSKCGCGMQCKNRVVQRGITCNLQVFFTPEGKGWGLRTLDELPRGTFVCEYVGEVLTSMELYSRRALSIANANKYTNPVLLDADWGSKGVVKDEEAVCLDATFYANVARFVNHRCVDANLIEIPVEVETPDHHYYHVAFFTTRRIEMYEELTWDYGIDFRDVGDQVKAFKCRCGSKFCRDTRRSKTRTKALVSR